jgi:EpsI family protein
MASLGLLILEMWLLSKIGPSQDRSSFLSKFTWSDPDPNLPHPTQPQPQPQPSSSPRSTSTSTLTFPPAAYLFSVALLIPVAFASSFMGEREEVPPERAIFVDFPLTLKGWAGTSSTLEMKYIDALRFDDYLLADYRSADGHPVNLYAAYYRSQRKGQSAHSPQSCLPGGGWEISSLNGVDLPADSGMARSLHVNRALIQKGGEKQIVLYWFKQRERIISNEYLVKFFLFWDGLTRGRTDGALVRISSVVGPGETEDVVDERLRNFVSTIEPELVRYVPD